MLTKIRKRKLALSYLATSNPKKLTSMDGVDFSVNGIFGVINQVTTRISV